MMFNRDGNKGRFIIKQLLSEFHRHRRVIDGVFLTLVLRGIQLLLGIFTTYCVVRSLSVDDFGHFSFLLTVVGAMSVFSLLGMPQTVSQSVARGYLGTFRAALMESLKWSMLAVLALFVVASYFFVNNNFSLAWCYSIAALFFPFIQALALWKFLCLGQEKYKSLFSVGLLNSVLNAAAVFSVVSLFPGNIVAILAAYWVVPALQNINQTFKALRMVEKDSSVEPGSVAYGRKNSLYSILGVISSNIDSFLVFMFLSPAHLAIFAVAQKMPELIKGNIQEVAKALMPKFSRQNSYTAKTDKFFKWFSLLVGSGILIITFTVYPFVFLHIFGEKYQDAIFYSQILMCSIALANVAPLKFGFVNSRLDVKTSRDMNLLIGLTRIVMSVIFIPLFGIKGAVISAVLHRAITSTAIHFLLKKRYPIVAGSETN